MLYFDRLSNQIEIEVENEVEMEVEIGTSTTLSAICCASTG